MAVSSLCIAAAVPATTALALDQGADRPRPVRPLADPQDGRRVYIELVRRCGAGAHRLSARRPADRADRDLSACPQRRRDGTGPGDGRLAQLVEHLVYTERVGGSSPSAPTSLPEVRDGRFSSARRISLTATAAQGGSATTVWRWPAPSGRMWSLPSSRPIRRPNRKRPAGRGTSTSRLSAPA